VPLKRSAGAAQGFWHFSQPKATFSLTSESFAGSIAVVPIDDKACHRTTLREI
jgi:hypothetical protein